MVTARVEVGFPRARHAARRHSRRARLDFVARLFRLAFAAARLSSHQSIAPCPDEFRGHAARVAFVQNKIDCRARGNFFCRPLDSSRSRRGYSFARASTRRALDDANVDFLYAPAGARRARGRLCQFRARALVRRNRAHIAAAAGGL